MLRVMDLSAVEVRVLGCLVEKQLTTPQQYPLTLNALVLACNQASNRDPVVSYDEQTVQAAVTSVKTKGLASFVHPSHGRSALRYRHSIDGAWGLDVRPLALVAVLMLRGQQTPGELRARTERMVQFADLGEVQAELDALAARDEPLVVRLRRVAGQKEDRYVQLLSGDVPPVETSPTDDAPPPPPTAVPHAELAALASAVEELRTTVGALTDGLRAVQEQLDDVRGATREGARASGEAGPPTA